MADPAQETPQISIETPSRALVVPTESNQFSRAARIQQEHFISGQTEKEFFNPFDETEKAAIQVHEKLVTDNIIAEMNAHPPASLEAFKAQYNSLQDPDIIHTAGKQLVDQWIEEGRFPESERKALTAIAQGVFVRLQSDSRNPYRVFLDHELSVVDVGAQQKSRISGRQEVIEVAKRSLEGRRAHDKPTPPVSQHTTLPERLQRLLGKRTIESPQIEIEPITEEDIEKIVDTLAQVGVDEDIRADFIQGLQRGLEEAQTVQNERMRQQEESRMYDAEQEDLRERSNNSRPLDLFGFPLAMKAVGYSQNHPTPGVTFETGGQHFPYTGVRVETADGKVVEVLRIYDTSDAYDTSRTRTQKPSAVQG